MILDTVKSKSVKRMQTSTSANYQPDKHLSEYIVCVNSDSQ
jgi:hypothetical protein